jgi:hypothetical protein
MRVDSAYVAHSSSLIVVQTKSKIKERKKTAPNANPRRYINRFCSKPPISLCLPLLKPPSRSQPPESHRPNSGRRSDCGHLDESANEIPLLHRADQAVIHVHLKEHPAFILCACPSPQVLPTRYSPSMLQRPRSRSPNNNPPNECYPRGECRPPRCFLSAAMAMPEKAPHNPEGGQK